MDWEFDKHEHQFHKWARAQSPDVQKTLIDGGALRRLSSTGISSAVTLNKDAAELPFASCDFEYPEEEEEIVPENLIVEPDMISGLLFVRDDIRPYFAADCILVYLKHSEYVQKKPSDLAEWHNVTVCTVYRKLSDISKFLSIDGDHLALIRWLQYIIDRPVEIKLLIDCIGMSVHHPAFNGLSLDIIGKKYGVMKQDMHKHIKHMRHLFQLPPNRSNKQNTDNYAIYNKSSITLK